MKNSIEGKVPPSNQRRRGHGATVGPCSYNVEKPRKHFPNFNWKRKLELEEFSLNLGFKGRNLLKEKEDEAKGGGPAVFDIPNSTDLLLQRSFNVRRNVGFSTGCRFPADKSKLPGPGTYIRKHGDMKRHQWTNICSFEWDNFEPRGCRPPPSWSLLPNVYAQKKNTIEERAKKKTSSRGPYDVFTGPRDETTIKNHFAPSKFKGAATWLRTLPAETERLNKIPWYGLWTTTERDILLETLDTHDDGPGDYDPIMPYTYKHEHITEDCPFGSSVFPIPEIVPYKVYPGPGRYTITDTRNKNGCRSAFLSKVARFDHLVPKKMNAF